MSTHEGPGAPGDWAVPGYTAERELARDGSGRVVAAVEDATGRRVAIRYLSPALAGDPAFLSSFRGQMQQLTRLDAPAVVKVYDYADEPGEGAAVIMERVSAVPLAALIERRGPLSPEAALAVFKGTLLGLAAVHRLGFGHRDCKPGNILVDPAGQVRLTDFGVALRASEEIPASGTPRYLAPERWRGEPATPGTDVYAATAVFYECLTGRPPFDGDTDRLREQHASAEPPPDGIDEPLLRLIGGGMAKDRADRPHSAIAFVSELEATAAAACGLDWEERGRGQLAAAAGALVPPARGGRADVAAAGVGPGQDGRSRRRLVALTALVAAVVVAAGGIAAGFAVSGSHGQARLSGSSSQAAASSGSFAAVANVTPPVAASRCDRPTDFTYSATLSATQRGTLSYQWVYSAGAPGPVQTASFAGAGRRLVAGATVRASKASGGWAEIRLLRPVALTSDRATWKLLCSGSAGGIIATAAVRPSARTASCQTAPPAFTATGSVTAAKAGTVSYYWAQSDGKYSAPATLTFSGPGTRQARPLTIAPPRASGSGEAVLVVTSPSAAASSPAAWTLTCAAPKAAVTAATPAASAGAATLSATATVSPASRSLTSCSAAPPTFAFTGKITDSKPGSVTYHWQLPGGSGPAQTLSFAGAGTKTVTSAYQPEGDSGSGSGTLVVTSPNVVSSNAAAFSLVCGQALAVTSDAATNAQVGADYTGTVTVSGGNGDYTWNVTGLPDGLTASGNGAELDISGEPGTAGTFTAQVSVQDSTAPPGTGTASLTINVTDPPLQIGGGLGTATLGQSYSSSVTASGGNGSYDWDGASGLPGGMTATPQGDTLVIAGTPTASGSFPVTVSVSDTESPAQTATASLTLVVDAPALQITTGSLPRGTQDAPYDATAEATGGDGDYTWSASGLPDGLSIDPGTGEIAGTPTASGTFRVELTVADSGTGQQAGPARAELKIDQAAASSPSPTPSSRPSKPRQR